MNRENIQAWDARWSNRLALGDQPRPRRNAAVFFAHSGDSWYVLLILLLVWLFGNAAWKERAMVFTVCILLTSVVVLLIKFTIRRKRPESNWGSIYRKTDPHSFPSGHAARAAMMAVIGLGIGPLWLGLALLVWAPLVAVARVSLGVHYLLDILGGILIGTLLGALYLWLLIPLLVG